MKKPQLENIISTAAEEALNECTSDNPIEAWTRFVDRLDAAGRRLIGNELEAQGKNRHTGEPT